MKQISPRTLAEALRRKIWLLVLAAILGAAFVSQSTQAAYLTPNLKKVLQSQPTQKQTVVVIYKRTGLVAHPPVQGAPSLAPVTAASALKTQAIASRPALGVLAARLGAAQNRVKDLWVANGYALEASAQEIESLSQDSQVEAIYENFTVETPKLIPQAQYEAASNSKNWGLDKVGAPEVWELYNGRGQGVRIGHLDTGVDGNHPDLAGKIAAWAEFDWLGNRIYSQPHDVAQHGTHTAGILVGGSSSGGPIGMAPAAMLLSAKVLDATGGTLAQVLAGLQWVIDPDGDPATDDGAQVVSLSLGTPGHYAIFDTVADDMLAAGALPVFAIGNDGPGHTQAPGNSVGVLSVGATRADDVVSSFSGSGQVVVNGVTYQKPEMVAPGQTIYSAIPGGSYKSFSGTSMATPHVAGAAALLKSLQPQIRADELKALLMDSADDIATPGVDSRSGAGRLNVLAAATTLMNLSVLHGTVAQDQGPVPALVTIHNKFDGSTRTVKANSSNGQFKMLLPVGSYDVEARFGVAQSASQDVSVAEGKVVNVSLALSGAGSSLDNLLVYPNPAKPAEGDNSMTFAGLPLNATLRIYSLSGALVRELPASASGDTQWDLNNSQSDSVASGLYFFVASNNDGGGTSFKKGKVAVIR